MSNKAAAAYHPFARPTRHVIITPTASEKCLDHRHGQCAGRAWDEPRLLPTTCKCPCHDGVTK